MSYFKAEMHQTHWLDLTGPTSKGSRGGRRGRNGYGGEGRKMGRIVKEWE